MESNNKYEQLRKAVGGFQPSNWLEETEKKHRELKWRKKSQKIALRILVTLTDQGKGQNDLANTLGVSPQQVNKWVKGSENFTLETITKIEEALGITLVDIAKDPTKPCLVVAFSREATYDDSFNQLVAAEPKLQYAVNS